MADVGREQSLLLNITVAAGTGTGSVAPLWAIARWVRIIPVTEADVYDVTFKDGDGDVIAVRTGQVGTMSEQLSLSLGILKTVVIANSSNNGTFKLKMDCH